LEIHLGAQDAELRLFVDENLDPVLGHLLVKLLLALGIVQRVAEAVAAALPHPDAEADALGLLLQQHLDPVDRAGGQSKSRLRGYKAATFDRSNRRCGCGTDRHSLL